MRTLASIVTAAAVLTAGAHAQSQPKPNFSGRWVVVSPPEGAGFEQIVKQDEKTLSTEDVPAGGRKMVYQLDGVERQQGLPPVGQGIVILATASWDGNRIVIAKRTSYPNGMKTEGKDIWSLDAQGRLVIDSTETGPTGPGPAMKIIFVKKS